MTKHFCILHVKNGRPVELSRIGRCNVGGLERVGVLRDWAAEKNHRHAHAKKDHRANQKTNGEDLELFPFSRILS